MAKKYYVVWEGRETGIFTDWDTCRSHVEKFAGAKYKSFKTLPEAEAAFGKNSSASVKKRTQCQSSTRRSSSSTSNTTKKYSKNTVKTYTAAEISQMTFDTKIFTDGGCEPNPGEAGSGLALYRNNDISELWQGLYNPKGTNNTAELNALNQALIIAKTEIEKEKTVAIFCDSKYSIQCITIWAANWEKKNWTKTGGEIKNLELIKEIYAIWQSLKESVEIFHVNGHVGVEGNELADRMSILAIEEKSIDFKRYEKDIDIQEILSLRTG